MQALAVLLRGVNVGGRNRVPMAELRELLSGMNFEDVRTLLQSGNVVLRSPDAPGDVQRAVEKAVAERFGVDADVMVRTAEEVAAVVAADPFAGVASDGSRYFVSFLADVPSTAPDLDATGFAPERFAHIGREVYVWCPNGLRDSPLMKALSERRLGVRATVRNWNTVMKLNELLGN